MGVHMLRIAIVTASVLLALGPALADSRNNPTTEEEVDRGIFTPTSQALGKAAHSATISQQTGSVTSNAATQMGVSTLFSDQ